MGNLRAFKSFLILCTALVLIVNYNNCGDQVNFSRAPASLAGPGGLGNVDPGTGLPTVNDTIANTNLDQIKATCMNSVAQVAEFSVSFINPEGQSCNFGQLDNLPPLDGFFQGHIDQSSKFNLPAGSTICGMNFTFNDLQMRYDDHFLVTFDDVMIASTFDFRSDLDKLLGLSLYSWPKIRGTPWHSRTNLEGIFCEGASQNLAACSWPRTDTFGPMTMRFDNLVFQKIIALNPTRTEHSFHLVSVGDNDTGDCEVSPISFKVQVQYVK